MDVKNDPRQGTRLQAMFFKFSGVNLANDLEPFRENLTYTLTLLTNIF